MIADEVKVCGFGICLVCVPSGLRVQCAKVTRTKALPLLIPDSLEWFYVEFLAREPWQSFSMGCILARKTCSF
jgi:hypothetical protein